MRSHGLVIGSREKEEKKKEEKEEKKEKKEEEKKDAAGAEFFSSYSSRSSTLRCTQRPIIQFRQQASKQAGERGEEGEAVIHVFMQPNKTQFRTYKKPNKTKFRTYRKGNKHYRRQETRNKIFLQK